MTIAEKRCPECGSTSISRKSRRGGRHLRKYPEDYRCNNTTCRAHFDTPLTKHD